MPYYLGVDAGGTKTAFLLTDERGRKMGACRMQGFRLLSQSDRELTALLREGLGETCRQCGASPAEVAFCGVGLSGYGEAEGNEEAALRACEAALGAGRVVCACDCYVAWAGALGMEAGVHTISGTGAISYGVSASGQTARASGWGATFDEGSCQWIGARLVQAYTRQADGRAPRTLLYERFRERFGIRRDTAFIHPLNCGFFDDAAEIARLQIFCLELFRAGDPCAAALYAQAADELAQAAQAVARSLGMGAGYRVSYSGGLFAAGKAILEPLAAAVGRRDGALVPPRYSPVEGAALTALRARCPDLPLEGLLLGTEA